MKFSGTRDLMVVSRYAALSKEYLEAETECLHALLDKVEAPVHVAASCEVINLNRYRIDIRIDKVLKVLLDKKARPFVFIFHKN